MEHSVAWRVLLGLWVLGMRSAGSRGASPQVYEVHMEQVNFDKAVEGCSGGGRLAELSTRQEASEVFRQAVAALEGSGPRAFWVGLRKTKEKCIVPHLPLRGFRWLSDGSERWEGGPRTEGGLWWEEPDETCTTSRCASLSIRRHGSGPPRWGLLAKACSPNLSFICQRPLAHTDPPLTGPPTGEPELPTTTPWLAVLATRDTTTARTPTIPTLPDTTHTSKPRPGPEAPAEPETPVEPGTPAEPGATGDPAAVPETTSCPTPSIPKSRFLVQESVGLLTVVCWSGDEFRLNCSDGRWELDGAAVPDTVCPTGSPSPPPAGETDAWAGLMVPVLVAVAVLVVLVVLVVVGVVGVRCCLARRSKDRAVRKAEKMALKNAAGGKDSMETTSTA